jgi:hypothetical protein
MDEQGEGLSRLPRLKPRKRLRPAPERRHRKVTGREVPEDLVHGGDSANTLTKMQANALAAQLRLATAGTGATPQKPKEAHAPASLFSLFPTLAAT